MKKKLLTILISITMLATFVPMEVFAGTVNVSFSSVTASKTKITAKWKQLSKKNQKKITGFQIMYSENEDFSDGEIIDINTKSASYKEIFNVKGDTTYYLQLRTKNAEEYSDWSRTKIVKTSIEDFRSIGMMSIKDLFIDRTDEPEYIEVGGGYFWYDIDLNFSPTETGAKKTLAKNVWEGITDGNTVYYVKGNKIKSTTIDGSTKTIKSVKSKKINVITVYNNCIYYATTNSKREVKSVSTLYKLNLSTKKVNKVTTKYQFGRSSYGQYVTCVKNHRYYLEGVYPEGVYNIATNTYKKMSGGVPELICVDDTGVTYDIRNFNNERKSMIYRYTFENNKRTVEVPNAYLRWINSDNYGYTYF